MTKSSFPVSFPIAIAALSIVSACGGQGALQQSTGASASALAIRAQALALHSMPDRPGWQHAKSIRPDGRRSWIEPTAKQNDLTYVSDDGTSDVYMYSYASRALQGTLTGFNYPSGLCADASGDVFVTNTYDQDVVEYAHGATTATKTLSDANQYPVACSVDPTTGNLAVANVFGGSGLGNVAIYAKATGTPQIYSDASIGFMDFAGYDDHGNLFVDGSNSEGSGFEFAELPQGSGTFTNIDLNFPIGYPGNVQWDGKYITVGDAISNFVYRVAVSGSTGTKVGVTKLKRAFSVQQFWINGRTVLGADSGNLDVPYWPYPASGRPKKTITGLEEPYGVTVSMASNAFNRSPRRSWMSPGAKSDDLLYVSSGSTYEGSVNVYDYPSGKQVGALSDLAFPSGMCVDANQDVFVTQLDGPRDILEYAHGGTSPIATLQDPQEFPIGCAVDPTTGNLAVANELGTYGSGSVSIYIDAQGSPEGPYTDSAFHEVWFCGYDDRGNLFIDGINASDQFVFAELPKGSSTFTNIDLNRRFHFPGGIQWDGEHLAVGDRDGGVIYQTTGAGGTVVHRTRLNGVGILSQFFIDKNTVIAPNNGTAAFYRYPKGGNAFKTIAGISQPFGAVVSKGKAQ